MIDLRSDTVTRPGRAMLEAMMAAPVGDDVYGDDPTVNELQRYAADWPAKRRRCFCPPAPGQPRRPAQPLPARRRVYRRPGAHNYLYEAGGAAVLGSIQPQPIDAAADGSLPLDKVAAKIKPDDIHFAPTRLLSLENTHNGKVLPRDYLQEARAFTRQRNLALHVDGARIVNAVVAYGGCELRDIAQYCDSFTICLSKGLGAPVGSLLVGSEAYIRRAVRWRKMVGGGMRQAGILAAAGLYALKNNVQRLQEDHDNAAWMADQLRAIGADVTRHDTNMLFVRVGDEQARALGEFMQARGVLINASPVVRLVTHRMSTVSS